MKHRSIVLFAAFLFIKMYSVAQAPIVLMSTPMQYTSSPDGTVLADSKIGKLSNTYWVVVSDRDGNKAFEKADNTSPVRYTASFMDKFYVTGETDEYLQLYKWKENLRLDAAGKRNQLDPQKAEYAGWIKKENLLLWTLCLENPETHFNEKALAVTNEKNFIKIGTSTNKGNFIVYNDPDLQTKSKNSIKMFQFLYVYKKVGRSVLLGKVYKSYSIELDIIGWLDEVNLQKWNDRVCLEPNWTNGSSRRDLKIKASLFENKEDVLKWKKGQPSEKPRWDDDPYEEQWASSRPRFPILAVDKDDTTLVYTGFQTNVFSDDGKVIADQKKLDNVVTGVNSVIKNYRSINIVFVLDVGAGMVNYGSAITNSLRQLIDIRNAKAKAGDNRNTYKYGAIAYRSVQDKNCNGGDMSLAKKDLSPQGGDVIGFLKEQLDKEGCSGDEKNKNVNKALLEALKMIKTENGDVTESNYVILLGGAAGTEDPDLRTLPQMISDYDVNLTVFQVKCAAIPEYENFSLNFTDIFQTAREKKDAKIKMTSKFVRIKEGEENAYRLDHPEHSSISGTLTFPASGGHLKPESIDNILDTSFSYFDKSLEKLIETNKTIASGVGEVKVSGYNADVYNSMLKVGATIKDFETVKKMLGPKSQFFFNAWTTTTVEKSPDPVFKHVIYVNDEELYAMIDQFKNLTVEESPSEARQHLADAYQYLAEIYFGKDSKMAEQFKNKGSVGAIIEKITGLPSRSKLLKDVRIDEIRDENKVTEDQIDGIQKAIRESLKNLDEVKLDLKHTYRDVKDGLIFYYVPEECLP